MRLSNLKQELVYLYNSKLFWLQVCAIGIWMLVIQNYFGREEGALKVYVVDGNIDADVDGSVEVVNTVPVEVENIVRAFPW